MSANALQTAQFVLGAHRLSQLPPDVGLEVAFAGRSNAGKSSAINALTARRALARTSRTPGRTQQLNVFALGPGRRLVDLPGYGYARAPEALRAHWARVLPAYLASRRSLVGVVVLVDIRLALKAADLTLIEACAARGLPLAVLATKADKLSNAAASRAVAALSRALAPVAGSCFCRVQAFSALRGQGVDDARRCIAGWLGLVDPPGEAVAPSAPAPG